MLSELAELEQNGTILILRVRCTELTHTQMRELTEECLERLRFHHACHFVFDMSEVQFLASACIGTLVELLRELEPMRGRIVLVGCQDSVAFVLKVTRLDTIFSLYDDVPEALAALHHMD